MESQTEICSLVLLLYYNLGDNLEIVILHKDGKHERIVKDLRKD